MSLNKHASIRYRAIDVKDLNKLSDTTTPRSHHPDTMPSPRTGGSSLNLISARKPPSRKSDKSSLLDDVSLDDVVDVVCRDVIAIFMCEARDFRNVLDVVDAVPFDLLSSETTDTDRYRQRRYSDFIEWFSTEATDKRR